MENNNDLGLIPDKYTVTGTFDFGKNIIIVAIFVSIILMVYFITRK